MQTIPKHPLANYILLLVPLNALFILGFLFAGALTLALLFTLFLAAVANMAVILSKEYIFSDTDLTIQTLVSRTVIPFGYISSGTAVRIQSVSRGGLPSSSYAVVLHLQNKRGVYVRMDKKRLLAFISALEKAIGKDKVHDVEKTFSDKNST